MTETDIILDDNTAIWDMGTIHGDLGGTYKGSFRFACYLSPMQQLAAQRKFRELVGVNPENALEHDKYLAWCLSQLEFRILKSPPFWTAPVQNGDMPGNIPDQNVILAVLDAAVRAEAMFKDRMLKERDAVLKRTIDSAETLLQEDAEEDSKEEE